MANQYKIEDKADALAILYSARNHVEEGWAWRAWVRRPQGQETKRKVCPHWAMHEEINKRSIYGCGSGVIAFHACWAAVGGLIPRWNDERCRSKDDVLAMFDDAISRVKESDLASLQDLYKREPISRYTGQI